MSDIRLPREEYIQSKIDARGKPAVIKLKLLAFRSKYPSGLLVAVEGNDDKVVYSHWIARIRPKMSYEFFVCGGKKFVAQLRNALAFDKGDALRDILFCVDRDFDDLAPFEVTDRVFMLDRYSVENYLVDSTVLDACLKIAYPGNSGPATRSVICNKFSEDYCTFLTLSFEFNRAIYISRRMKFDIDDIMPLSLAPFIDIKIGNVAVTGNLATSLVPTPQPVPEEKLAAMLLDFTRLDPLTRYRGKFSYKFLRLWLDALAADFRRPKLGLFSAYDQDDGKIKHDELSLGSLAAHSQIPEHLDDFFTRYGYRQ